MADLICECGANDYRNHVINCFYKSSPLILFFIGGGVIMGPSLIDDALNFSKDLQMAITIWACIIVFILTMYALVKHLILCKAYKNTRYTIENNVLYEELAGHDKTKIGQLNELMITQGPTFLNYNTILVQAPDGYPAMIPSFFTGFEELRDYLIKNGARLS